MRKKMYFFILLIILFFLTGCTDNYSNNNQEKLQAEINYFSSKIINLANKLNNISLNNYEIVSQKIEISKQDEDSESSSSQSNDEQQSKSESGMGSQSSEETSNNEENSITITQMQANSILNNNASDENIDWNNIKNEIEIINSSWSVVSIDLTNSNVPDEDISNFNKVLNNCIISIKEENKNLSLSYLSELYSFIPKFLDYIYMDNSQKIIKKVQKEVLIAYTAVSQNNWDNVQEVITTAENIFAGIFADSEFMKDREFKIGKTQVLIKELKEASITQDSQLFYLKYKVLQESINTL